MVVLNCILELLLLTAHVLSAARVLPSDEGLTAEWDDAEEDALPVTNCSRCTEKKERKALRLRVIKNQILSQLGLKEAPNITHKVIPHIPPLDNLLDHYSMQRDAPNFVPGPEYGDDEDFYIDTEKVLAFAQQPPKPVEVDHGDQQIYFKLSSSVLNSQVQTAHLWIYLRSSRHALHRNVTLYQVDRLSFGQLDMVQIRRKTLDKKIKHGYWIIFEVRKTVSHWLKHPKENLGFVLHSSGLDASHLLNESLKENTSVTLHTDVGDLKVELFCEQCPIACENFLALCASSYYDGSLFHRNIKSFIIQCGDPTGTGKGGTSIWGKKFEDEVKDELKHNVRGMISMASNGQNTNGSQFFITYAKQPHLDMKYTVFAKVIDGLETLDELEKLSVNPKTFRPLNDTRLNSVTIHSNPLAK